MRKSEPNATIISGKSHTLRTRRRANHQVAVPGEVLQCLVEAPALLAAANHGEKKAGNRSLLGSRPPTIPHPTPFVPLPPPQFLERAVDR